MKPLSVRDIRESLQHTERVTLADDGWAYPSLSRTVTNYRDTPLHFREIRKDTFKLELVVNIETVPEKYNEELILDRCASQIHKELYLPIVRELAMIRSKARIEDRESVVEAIGNLLDKFL